MRQLLYISTAAPGAGIDIGEILAISMRNNRREGVTGLLWTDAHRFLQVLEGPEEAVQGVLGRIKIDARHRGIVVLQDRTIAVREFGAWEMARRGPGDTADAFDGRMRQYLAGASPSVRGTFEGLIAARRAA
ncbi:BLUF domain-containing protein [Sphingomonas dokdonensis]|uniref:Blue light-and temperature-regulated antirepressor YcgF n=1 Tax=Sphingomonas dokdonensis TaxID=344880 RepID=A0A245ZHQ6_9SPHN|nr:BLUF domain-containing protein [Sphingomonas dokdonensis]OWK29276.1 blue light- and temperature-regulated antirepressor YcgF [Sphingomonas dokdonensis]